jgi:hypothetical protein
MHFAHTLIPGRVSTASETWLSSSFNPAGQCVPEVVAHRFYDPPSLNWSVTSFAFVLKRGKTCCSSRCRGDVPTETSRGGRGGLYLKETALVLDLKTDDDDESGQKRENHFTRTRHPPSKPIKRGSTSLLSSLSQQCNGDPQALSTTLWHLYK